MDIRKKNLENNETENLLFFFLHTNFTSRYATQTNVLKFSPLHVLFFKVINNIRNARETCIPIPIKFSEVELF